MKFVSCKVYSENLMFVIELGQMKDWEQIDSVHNISVDKQWDFKNGHEVIFYKFLFLCNASFAFRSEWHLLMFYLFLV